MKNDQLLEVISNKLSAVLLVLLSPEIEAKNIAQKVELLARLKLPNQEVADIVGTTKGTVEVIKKSRRQKTQVIVMAEKKVISGSESELADLLKKILIVQLFQLGVPQSAIAKKVKLRANVVNALLKGIKKNE